MIYYALSFVALVVSLFVVRTHNGHLTYPIMGGRYHLKISDTTVGSQTTISYLTIIVETLKTIWLCVTTACCDYWRHFHASPSVLDLGHTLCRVMTRNLVATMRGERTTVSWRRVSKASGYHLTPATYLFNGDRSNQTKQTDLGNKPRVLPDPKRKRGLVAKRNETQELNARVGSR